MACIQGRSSSEADNHMSNQIVFFGPVQVSPSGPKWWRFGSGGGGEIAFCVENGVRIDPAETDPLKIARLVEEQMALSPGCIITLAAPVNSKVRLKVQRNKGSSSMGLAQTAMAIGLRGHVQWFDLKDGAGVDLDVSESLILPAWKGHEKKLKAFIETLEDLPDDYRVSMLFTLLQPTFETRIARLEQLEAGRKESRPAVMWQPSSSDGPTPIGFWESIAISSLVVVLLGLAQLFVYLEVRSLQDKVDAISQRIVDGRTGQQSIGSESASGPENAANVNKPNPPATPKRLKTLSSDTGGVNARPPKKEGQTNEKEKAK